MLMLLTSKPSAMAGALSTIHRCRISISLAFMSSDSVAPSNHDKRRRRRHKFSLSEDIPSFQEFQQRQKVRSLYRQFLRLIRTLSAAGEMKQQIRREFRVEQPDLWHAQRAVSEGIKRYKEVSAMVANAVTNDQKAQKHKIEPDEKSCNEETSARTSAWPWQSGNYQQEPPNPFPKR